MQSSFRRVLAPIDFSDSSAVAIRYATELARSFGGTVHVLHAWEVPPFLRPDLTVWAGEVSATLGDQVRFSAERAMGEFATKNGLTAMEDVTFEVLQGSPFKTILRVAEDGEFDLIVMGTHGRTGLSHMLIGSVAEKVVRRARCPVLTVTAPAPAPPL